MKQKLLFITLLLATWTAGHAQTKMRVTLNDGRIMNIPVDSIAHISIHSQVSDALKDFEGNWMLVASNNGSVGAGGISVAGTDSISFTAVASSDGIGLLCQASHFFTRTGNSYPATWRMLVEEKDGKHRVGWVLDETQPASTREFDEPREQYLENGSWYWGTGQEEHHYIYLLSENIQTQRREGMTLWSEWYAAPQQAYALPQNQEVYGMVATTIPYQSNATVGCIEIWASPRFVRFP